MPSNPLAQVIALIDQLISQAKHVFAATGDINFKNYIGELSMLKDEALRLLSFSMPKPNIGVPEGTPAVTPVSASKDINALDVMQWFEDCYEILDRNNLEYDIDKGLSAPTYKNAITGIIIYDLTALEFVRYEIGEANVGDQLDKPKGDITQPFNRIPAPYNDLEELEEGDVPPNIDPNNPEDYR